MPDPHGDYYNPEPNPPDHLGGTHEGSAYGNITMEEEPVAPAGSGESFVATQLPFSFNPPLHPSARHVAPDLGSRSTESSAESFLAGVYDETGNKYGKKAADNSKFSDLRLGRIVMADEVLSWALLDADTRFGFRFLYNPTSVQRAVQVNDQFVPDPASTIEFVLQDGLEKISFELLINRIPDVNGRADRSSYRPTITDWQRKQIQRRGTHFDLEYLYRCANGLQYTQVRKNTGDIGILLPNPCHLILGGEKSRGAIESVQVNDQMFSEDMVPILSYVTITFARFLTFEGNDYSELESIGIQLSSSVEEDEEGGDEASSTGSSVDYATGIALKGREVRQLAVNAGFSGAEADLMTQFAWAESTWRPWISNGTCCHGLWQIHEEHVYSGFLVRKGIAKRVGDLRDPAVNAKAAKALWDDALSRGAEPRYLWEVYEKGTYKKAPAKVLW